ncbi:hypothetical protein Tco_1429836 [Tanacetum coccineum]
MKVRENDKPSAQHSRFLKMFKQLRLEIGLKDALVEMPKFNKWLSSLLRNKEKLEEIAIMTVNAECSAIIINKVPEKLEDPGKFLIPYIELEALILSPLFEFDDNFKSSNVNPLFEENDKDTEIKSSSSFTLTSLEENKFEAYLERVSIPLGIDLTLPPTLEVLNSNPTSPTLTGEKVCSWKTPMFFSLIRFVWKMMTQIAIRKKIICLLATYLHQQPKFLSRPQEVEEIKENDDEVSSDVPIHTIVMPIRITFDNPIDFNAHFSKPKDLKKDLTVLFDSSESSILPSSLLDSDSPFTAELSASVTLNSLGNEDKVFKPGILVYHTIHDNNLIPLEENLKENISSETLLVFKEPSFLLPPPEPPDIKKCFEPEAGILIIKEFKLPMRYDYQKSQENHQKQASTDTRTEECTKAESQGQKKSNLQSTPVNLGQQKSTRPKMFQYNPSPPIGP